MFLGYDTDLPKTYHDALQAVSAEVKEKGGKLSFTPFPNFERVERYSSKVDEVGPPRVSVKHSIFVGQVPNLLPLQYLAWVLDTIIGEYGTTWVLQTAKNGCAKAWMRDEQAQHKVITMNRRVLFDVTGFWLAEDDTATAALRAHVQRISASGAPSQDPRLPRGLMVLEIIKSQAR